MTRNRLIAISLVVAVAIGGYLAWDQVLRGDDVAPLALPSASPAPVATEPIATAAPSVDPGTGTSTGSDFESPVAGTWTVVEGSEAGYRVREQLANLPAETDAVGRTNDVSGAITLEAAGDGARLTSGEITVDTTTIASDEGRRDDRMRTEGLETDAYRTATFVVTVPVDIPASALEGTAADVTLAGDLTLHGVTTSVEIPAEAQLIDGQVQVAGSLTFALADFDIVAPNVGGFIISIADEGALEFLLVFERA
jgi:polyisoprenoid-binding protein YceI